MAHITSFNINFSYTSFHPITQQQILYCCQSLKDLKDPSVPARISGGNFRVNVLKPTDRQPGRLELLEKIEFVLEKQWKPDNETSASLLNQLIDRVDELRHPLKWLDYIGSFFYTTDYQAQCEQIYNHIKSLGKPAEHG